jgi:aminopeptidase N
MTQIDTFKVNIFYHGKPYSDFNNWPFGGLAFHSHNGTSIVETMSEPESSHWWFPCKDVPTDKAKAEIKITTWSNHLAASNGLLQSKTSLPGNKTVQRWKVDYPITTYLIAISVTDYTLQSQSYTSLDGMKTMAIQNFVFPEKIDDAEKDFEKVPEMIKAMSLKFGEYPFINEKYGNAMVTFPGMEHQTISAMGVDYINGTGESEVWLVFPTS